MSSSTLTNPKFLSELLESENIKLSHALGQNFLVNKGIIDKIIKLADANFNDEILEIGPGIGTLTCALLETGAHVVAIEKDSRLKNLLLRNTSFALDKFKLIEEDALNWKELSIGSPNKLVANLPYNVAATLVLDLFQNAKSIESATVMVQKEVADRMNAKVGTKNYGAYTVKLRLFAECAGSFFVSRNNFLPAPRVDSAVIRLNRKKVSDLSSGACVRDMNVSDVSILKNACKAADAAFFSRRKTIFNSCKAYFGNAEADNILSWLEACEIDPKVRGEKLNEKDYVKLGIQFDNFLNKCHND